jgi:rfaE bifunctional protein kinase chain/domain
LTLKKTTLFNGLKIYTFANLFVIIKMPDANYINNIFNGFANRKVLIIGDIMLDSYIWGNVERISPEAPVPVVDVKKRENRLGGAANVGLNIKSLGAEAFLCSITGNDTKADELFETLQKAGLSQEGIIKSNNRKTTVKFRIIADNTQLLRVDEETTEPLNEKEFELITGKIKRFCESGKTDVIIFQDYDKGVITPELIDFTVNLAKKHNIPVAVDPKKRNFLSYKNVTLIKPNLKEISEGLNKTLNETADDISMAAKELKNLLNAKIVLNTLSEKGMFATWHEEGNDKDYHTKAHLRQIADVSGAGDTVISVASLCLAQNTDIKTMVELSNLAGGLVCEEAGVVPVNKQKFLNEAIRLFS